MLLQLDSRSLLLALLLGSAIAFPGEKDRFQPDAKWCNEKTCYEALGLEPSAKKKAIKQRFRELSLTMHPDKVTNPDEKERAEELFGEITYAKEILMDKKKRKSYDRYLLLKKNMDSPKESLVSVLVGMMIVLFAIVHTWRQQRYYRTKETLSSDKDIKKWLDAQNGKRPSRKELIKARKLARAGQEAACEYTDEQITEALNATYSEDACPHWQGRPTYLSSVDAIAGSPARLARAVVNSISTRLGKVDEDDTDPK